MVVVVGCSLCGQVLWSWRRGPASSWGFASLEGGLHCLFVFYFVEKKKPRIYHEHEVNDMVACSWDQQKEKTGRFPLHAALILILQHSLVFYLPFSPNRSSEPNPVRLPGLFSPFSPTFLPTPQLLQAVLSATVIFIATLHRGFQMCG